MAPWNLSWPFGDAGPELPESIEPMKGGTDTAFEVFIEGALTKIYNEAGGRSKESRGIREACKRVLGEPEISLSLSSGSTCNQTALCKGRLSITRSGLAEED